MTATRTNTEDATPVRQPVVWGRGPGQPRLNDDIEDDYSWEQQS